MNPGLSQELIKMNSWQFRGSIVIARRQMITIHSTMDAASTRVCHLQSDRLFYCFGSDAGQENHNLLSSIQCHWRSSPCLFVDYAPKRK